MGNAEAMSLGSVFLSAHQYRALFYECVCVCVCVCVSVCVCVFSRV